MDIHNRYLKVYDSKLMNLIGSKLVNDYNYVERIIDQTYHISKYFIRNNGMMILSRSQDDVLEEAEDILEELVYFYETYYIKDRKKYLPKMNTLTNCAYASLDAMVYNYLGYVTVNSDLVEPVLRKKTYVDADKNIVGYSISLELDILSSAMMYSSTKRNRLGLSLFSSHESLGTDFNMESVMFIPVSDSEDQEAIKIMAENYLDDIVSKDLSSIIFVVHNEPIRNFIRGSKFRMHTSDDNTDTGRYVTVLSSKFNIDELLPIVGSEKKRRKTKNRKKIKK